jgi:hypothetical protein
MFRAIFLANERHPILSGKTTKRSRRSSRLAGIRDQFGHA